MKRIILFFTVCLGLSVSQTTFAALTEIPRSTTKRAVATNISNTKRSDNQPTRNARTTSTQPSQRVVGRGAATQNVKSRTNTTNNQKNVTTRTAASTRNTAQSRVTGATVSRTANSSANRQRATRTKELNVEKMAAIKSADYSQCKDVYYECMDEFCAHKDANLGRCACSSRIHEFDNIKKQLDAAEDKMLDFNQRLLTVSLDKEDAAAINVASEGELAFNTKDKSKSEKYLKKIQKTLDSSGDSRFDNNLSTISLSLDLDSAWDDVDSLSGITTSAKNGLDLYNAARPICIEMAQEVCSDDELKIAQDGYTLTIQQDCNTVAKSYNTLYNNAMEKIHESGALLDMARLDSYQQRNSDDTLTCKKKILEKLSETSVCGENLYKCLDMTGEYIDPSTGKAFLSENLYNLTDLLKEPTGGLKWSEVSQNAPFVNFLKSKKRFLTTATEQCRDISDTIWREFLDDALSQIKLAQKAKLEEIRRSCTALVSECKTNAMKDLSEFDARTLSVFKVNANKTVNEMCRDVQNSCVALMGTSVPGEDWETGIVGITTDVSYDTLIETCTQIGRDCIIQKCNGTSGNFSLCINVTADNRIAILKRDTCWEDVFDCVKKSDDLENMNKGILSSYDPEQPDKSRQKYYESNYTNITYSTTPHICDLNDKDYMACLIAEQIWGNCETYNGKIDNDDDDNNDHNNNGMVITTLNNLPDTISHIQSNKILIPKKGSTLMSWFAANTGTTDNVASCNTYGCPVNYRNNDGTCQLLIDDSTDDCYIATNKNQKVTVVKNNLINFCASGKRDAFGNCCANGYKDNGICVPAPNSNKPYHALPLFITTCDEQDDYFCPNYDDNPNNPRKIYYYCLTTDDAITYEYVNDEWRYDCGNGWWMLVDLYGNYFNPTETIDPSAKGEPLMTYIQNCTDCDYSTHQCTGNLQQNQCIYNYNNDSWSFGSCQEIDSAVPTSNEFIIEYHMFY